MIHEHVIAILVVLLAFSNAYWWWQSKSDSIDPGQIREWQEPKSPSTIDRVDGTDETVEELSNLLNCKSDDIIETVEGLDHRVRELVKKKESIRTRWIDYWWAGRTEELPAGDQLVITVMLPNAAFEDIKQLAMSATDREKTIAIVGTGSEEAFAVGVSPDFSGEYDATEIASQIAEIGGGGGGGSKGLATGGGVDQSKLESVIKEVGNHLQERTNDTQSPDGEGKTNTDD